MTVLGTNRKGGAYLGVVPEDTDRLDIDFLFLSYPCAAIVENKTLKILKILKPLGIETQEEEDDYEMLQIKPKAFELNNHSIQIVPNLVADFYTRVQVDLTETTLVEINPNTEFKASVDSELTPPRVKGAGVADETLSALAILLLMDTKELDYFVESAISDVNLSKLETEYVKHREANLKRCVRMRLTNDPTLLNANARDVVRSLEAEEQSGSRYADMNKKSARILSRNCAMAFCAILILEDKARRPIPLLKRQDIHVVLDRICGRDGNTQQDLELIQRELLESRPKLQLAIKMSEIRMNELDESQRIRTESDTNTDHTYMFRLSQPPWPQDFKIQYSVSVDSQGEIQQEMINIPIKKIEINPIQKTSNIPRQFSLYASMEDVQSNVFKTFIQKQHSIFTLLLFLQSVVLPNLQRFAESISAKKEVYAIASQINIVENRDQAESLLARAAILNNIDEDIKRFLKIPTLEKARENIVIQRERSKDEKIKRFDRLNEDERRTILLLRDTIGTSAE
jgi:hypothetical protein